MIGYGIGLGIIVAILKAVDTLFSKSLAIDKSTQNHAFYCIVFTIPFLMCMALFNWNLKMTSFYLVVVYGLLEAVNIYCHQKAIKLLNPIHTELLSKSKTLMIYIVSIILLVESVTVEGIVAIILFMVGIFVSIDFSLMDYRKFSNIKGYIFEIISVVMRTIKPFVLRRILITGEISNEVLVLLSMIIAGGLIFIFFRPEFNLKKNDIKNYLLRAGIDSVAMVLSGYAVLYAGALLTSMLENLSIFLVAIMSYFVYKKKVSLKIWIGIIFVTTSLILIG